MSGGGSNTSNTVSEFKPPDYTQQPWQNYVANAGTLSAQGLPIYTGQTVAPLSQQGQVGVGQLTSLATQGSPLYDTAQTSLQGMLQGDFSNPYATAANPYIGNNSYIQQLVDQSNQQLAQNYARGTAAQTDAAAAREGAYGGSGEQEAQARNAQNLSQQIAQNTNSLLGQNYYNSANLAEQGLNRAANSVNQTQQMQLQAAGLAPQYQQSDINAIQAMMGGGQQVQGYQQNLLNAAQGLFNQYQQAPWQLSDLLGGALSRASGQGGTTSSSVFQPMSLMQGLLGAGVGGAGLYSMFGGGGA
jgi:hypothetical protein